MSFGLFKDGANTTDKKLMQRYLDAGWPLDKISNKLSIRLKVIERFAERVRGGDKAEAAPVAEVASAPKPKESMKDKIAKAAAEDKAS
jgi:hypothetical protein